MSDINKFWKENQQFWLPKNDKQKRVADETSVIYGKESEYKKHLNIWMSMKLAAI